MSIRCILVPVRGDGKGEGVLDHALAFGRRFDAHIDVVHCRPRPEDLLPFGVFVPNMLRNSIISSAGTLADEEEQRLKALFDEYCQRHDLPVVDERPWPEDGISISWREKTGKQAEIVGLHGRLADVIAIAQPDYERGIGLNTLEAALLETGKLVLMCPPNAVQRVGTHVALAWNASAEGARAVTAALPILKAADTVTILSVSDDSEVALGPQDLRDHLASHRIEARIERKTAKATAVGDSLLGTAASVGADLLLMGAYGQSRRRELVMGGVTQHVIDHAEMPVLLMH